MCFYSLYWTLLRLFIIISGRGTVVSGKLERGVIKKGDEAVIMGHNKSLKANITGII